MSPIEIARATEARTEAINEIDQASRALNGLLHTPLLSDRLDDYAVRALRSHLTDLVTMIRREQDNMIEQAMQPPVQSQAP